MRMTRGRAGLLPAVALVVGVLAACGTDDSPAEGGPTVVVSFPVLGAVVGDVVGEAARVQVLMPNGVDPHDWAPSARDVEALNDADLVVVNGFDLEAGLEDAVAEAERAGVAVFRASDHVEARTGDPDGDHGDHSDDGDHDDHGAEDPHLWTDPVAMAAVARALGDELARLGLDVEASTAATVAELEQIDADVAAAVATVAPERRKLVTGHESLGYYADRYGFELVGAVVPSLTTQAEVNAGELAELADLIEAEGVPAIFLEVGEPASVVEAIAGETGAEVVEVRAAELPDDGTYRTFMIDLTDAITSALA